MNEQDKYIEVLNQYNTKISDEEVAAKMVELLTPAGDNLVDIGLMAHIKNYFILGRGEDTV